MTKFKPLTTGQAAEYCHVSQATIVNWIKKGTLKAYTTPGGHHRILLSDFLSFLETYRLPVDPTLRDASQARVLIVSDAPNAEEVAQTIEEGGRFSVSLASSEFEAGAKTIIFNPDAIVLDASSTELNWTDLCQRLRTKLQEKRVLVLAWGSPGKEDAVRGSGADAYIPGHSAEGLKSGLSALLMDG